MGKALILKEWKALYYYLVINFTLNYENSCAALNLLSVVISRLLEIFLQIGMKSGMKMDHIGILLLRPTKL